jgi:hypothetical protein
VAWGRRVDAGAGTPVAVSAAQGQTMAAQRASGVAARRVGWRGRGRWLGEQRRRRQNKKRMRCEVCAAHGDRELSVLVQNFKKCQLPWYIHWLTNDYRWQYIHWLTDECTGLRSLVKDIFLGSRTAEYKNTEECKPFSYSDCLLSE